MTLNYLLPQFIDHHAERAPDRQAVGFLQQTFSYAGLAQASNRLARALVEQGVRRGDRVGIYSDKCIETPVAVYGVMKAGAAYVPLDPGAPAERLAFILRDCGIRHLITADDKLAVLREVFDQDVTVECLIGTTAGDGDGPSMPVRRLSWAQLDTLPGDAPPGVHTIEQDLAYIIYTSGSTGRPKGIMHTHHSGLSFARWAAAEYGLRPDDRLGNHAPLHFDLSTLDFFAAAVAGAATILIPEPYTRLPASYSQLIAEQRLTVLYTVPFALTQLLLRGLLDERNLSALRWVIFAGEPFSVSQLHALMKKMPGVRFDNMYGPAEVNGCSHYTVPAAGVGAGPVPIGPIASVAQALIVDDADRPVTPGQTGELLVRTPTMMQGYWRRPDLNARAFYRREPFPGFVERYYRTGDLVREADVGGMQFLGRKDRQIKVRGYRVELDEVEAALTADPAVAEAACFALPDANLDGQQIRAAVILKQGAGVGAAELQAGLQARLPRYALPARLELSDDFPRTTTGKIDRRALRARALAENSAGGPSSDPTTAG